MNLPGEKRKRGNVKNVPMDAERRRELIARLYCEGRTQLWIVDHLKQHDTKVSQKTVATDLKWLQERWRTTMALKVEEHKARELARLDHLEVLAMEQFLRSCEREVTREVVTEKQFRTVKSKSDKLLGKGKATKFTNDGSDVGDDVQVLELVPVKEYHKRQVKGGVGDPRFLDLVRKITMDRLKVLGVVTGDKTTVDVNVNGDLAGKLSWDTLAGVPTGPVVDKVQAKLLGMRQAAEKQKTLGDGK